MKNRKLHPFAALAVLASATTVTNAAPGSLHSGFGSGGKVTANYGASESAAAVAVGSNGKIVVAGTSTTFGQRDIAVLRYNSNGSLDTSFSGDGGVLTDIGFGSTDFATCVAVQSDGKIVVGGYTNASGTGTDLLLLRYNTNGTLDTSFGDGGRILYNITTDEQVAAVAIQPDGKIILVGTIFIGSSPDFCAIRFKKDGSPDATFKGGSSGFYSFGGNDFATSVALQKDGKIVIGGYTNTNVNDFALVRLLPDGTFDNTFDTDGKVTINAGSDDRAAAVKIQSDGKILVAGTTVTGSDNFILARLNSNGTPDLPFGGSNTGRINNSFGDTDVVTSMVLQPDGKAILAGYSNAGPGINNDFALARYNTDGTQDLSFGVDGELLTDIATDTSDRAFAAALQPDGRIVLAGQSGSDFAAARYNLFSRADARIGAKSSANSGNNVYNTTGASQSLNVSVPKGGGKKSSFVRIQNDGHENAAITVQGTAGNGSFTVRYLSGSTNVTSAVVGGSFSTGSLASGASIVLKVEITAKTKAANKTRDFKITATGGGTTDAVLVKAKSK